MEVLVYNNTSMPRFNEAPQCKFTGTERCEHRNCQIFGSRTRECGTNSIVYSADFSRIQVGDCRGRKHLGAQGCGRLAAVWVPLGSDLQKIL